ncbi:MAG: carboxypeptidase regulatory-like domain-containing protein, partial [Bifidobacteriaceae bacterium]|nr:carboxypeptidase regulatory-like domain-containing protein [Bifidobacteriaceae bacterium]
DITDQVNASGGTYQLDDIDQTHHIDVTFIEGYTVGGTVQDPNRTPVAGAEVVLVKPDPEGGEPTVVAGPVTTGPGGTWAIPGVLPDTGYEIQVTKPGYDTATSNPFDVQDTNVTITDPIVMTPTGPSYEVTGQVGSTRPGSDPITEGTATLVVPSGEGDGQFTVIAGPVDIQPDGTFTFGHIPEGTDYQVQIDVPGYSTGSSGSFDVADQNVTLPGTIDLTPQYDIGGTGVYDHGTVTVSPNPVDWKGDATVTITADPGYSIGTVTDTDAEDNVTDITDQVNASGGTYQLDDIDQTHHIDVTFIPGHTVTGTVDGPDGQPVAGAEVSVVKPGGSGEEPTVVAGPAITGPDGAYGVPGVDNGSGFQIQVVKPGYYATTSDPFDVEDGDVAIGNLDLDGKYRVRTVTGTTGSATAQTATVPEAGQDTVVITPGPGYQVDRVEDATGGQITDVTAQLVDNRDGTWTLTLKHVMADHVVYVSFKPGGASATNPGGTTPGGSTGTGTTPGGPGTTTPPPAGPVAAKVKAALGQVNLLKGKSYKLVALAYTADGASVPVTFKSSKAKVASVSASGKVKAKKPGKAIITIVSGAQMTKVKVTVLKKRPSSAASTVKKVTVKLKKKLKTGQIVYLTPKLGPKTALAVKVTFKSTKKKVAAIDKAGRLQAMAKGKATIKVKAGKVTKKLKLTVK